MTVHVPGSPIRRAIDGFVDDFIVLRRDLHRWPELAFEEHGTSARIAGLLEGWGYEVTRGIGRTGVVGTLRSGRAGRALGIRADFDALPIDEATGLDHASRQKGRMHACGHDGHTAILLAAARYLAETRRFDGTLHLFFQPAEEVGGGARAMLGDRLFERFPVEAVFALHNWPGVPAGRFGFVEGPAMAAVDRALIRVRGKGGHGAEPQDAVDPVVASAHVVTALQTLVSRNVDPREAAVVTIGAIHGGDAANVIPDHVDLKATIRTFQPHVRDLVERRLPALVEAQATSFGAEADISYQRGFPAVVNDPGALAFARETLLATQGPQAVVADFAPRTASEDFAFLLEQRPGAFIFVGNGPSAPLHSPRYDFNDAIIAPAAAFWAALAERFLAAPALAAAASVS